MIRVNAGDGLPVRASPARVSARLDRRRFARDLEHWQRLFERCLRSVVLEPFSVQACGVALRNLVCFKGRPR
jgi:hypothetical protein